MADGRMNPEVDEYLGRAQKWQVEFSRLRMIALDCGLGEELKWGVPCYTLGKANVVLIHGFKEYCAIAFFKGALLKDPEHILIQQTENVQSARQLRFTSVQEIDALEPTIKAFIREAIGVEEAGLEVDFEGRTEPETPEELEQKFVEGPAFKAAFEALTPGRQRAYIFFFAQPKQPKTRQARIEKCMQQILDGKGLHD